MKVCAVIVTYGDRFHLLKQVMEACYKEGVNKIIVVDNASSENSRNKLKEYEKYHKDNLKVIHLDENTGSAGGYKRGLQEAYKCKDCEYIWLLDDDNMPQKNSLKILKDFWNSLYNQQKDKITLLSNRVDKNLNNLLTPVDNSFLGFHFKNFFIKRKDANIEVAPYGGLFFHKVLIDKIGYPNEKFFLYVDDYEWTYKISKIILIKDSLIKDIDKTTIKTSKINNFFNKTYNQLYYGIRNRIIWEKSEFVNNKFIYFFNMFLYLNILFLINLKYINIFKLKIFLKAIFDGLQK